MSVKSKHDTGETFLACLKYVQDVAKLRGGANDRDILRATLDLWGALLTLEMGALKVSDANVQVSEFHYGEWTRKQKFAAVRKNSANFSDFDREKSSPH